MPPTVVEYGNAIARLEQWRNVNPRFRAWNVNHDVLRTGGIIVDVHELLDDEDIRCGIGDDPTNLYAAVERAMEDFHAPNAPNAPLHTP